MKKYFTILAMALCLVSCGKSKDNTTTSEIADTPAERIAIDSIPFFVSEIEFEPMAQTFVKSHENTKWHDDMINEYPYLYNGYGFNNIRGIFSIPDGKLIGVVLSGIDVSEYDTKFPNNATILSELMEREHGKPTDIHSGITENRIKEEGELPSQLWNLGKKSVLTTYAYNGENFSVKLYIYRNDKINVDTTLRRIDSDMAALRKLLK